MGAEHHPFGLRSRQVEQDRVGGGGPLDSVDPDAGSGEPQRGRQARGRLRRDAERRNALLPPPAGGARDGAGRERTRDQEADRARLASPAVFEPAVDVAGREHVFVPHERYASGQHLPRGGELLGGAAADRNDLRVEAVGSRRHRPDEGMTRERDLASVLDEGQRRRAGVPAVVGGRHEVRRLPGRGFAQTLQQRSSSGFGWCSGQASAAIADRRELGGQQRVGEDRGRHGGGQGHGTGSIRKGRTLASTVRANASAKRDRPPRVGLRTPTS